MSAPPPVEASVLASAGDEKVGGGRRFSLSSVVGTLSASVGDVRAGATRLADLAATELGSVFDSRPGAADEFPAVLLEPEPETLVGWEARARSLEAHWRDAMDQIRSLRTHCAAQEERIDALQAEADMAQAYAAQVSALEDEIGILNRNEQALRQVLAQHTNGHEQGEVIKLLQGELRDMQVELRAVAKQSRASREHQGAMQAAEAGPTSVAISSPGGDASCPMDDAAPATPKIHRDGAFHSMPPDSTTVAAGPDRPHATDAAVAAPIVSA
jgi:hypothetical protein